MSIMLEAQEFHMIEQNNKKEKYEESFKQFMKTKIKTFFSVQKKIDNHEEITSKDLDFLVESSSFLFDKSKIKQYKFLEDHHRRLEMIATNEELFGKYYKISDDYYHFIEYSIKPTHWDNYHSLFAGKKLRGWIEEANRLLNEYTDDNDVLSDYNLVSHYKPDVLEKMKNDTLSIKDKINNNENITNDERDELLSIAESSIAHLNETGQLFFSHHFRQVDYYSNMQNKLKKHYKIFYDFYKVIRHVSKCKSTFGSNNYTVNSIRKYAMEHCFDSKSDYRLIKNRRKH